MNVLVLNLGMKSIRSIIFDQDGRKLSSASRPLKSAINNTRVEQYPEEWWEKAVEVMQISVKDAGTDQIDYITVTASASCLVCLQKDGTPYKYCLMVSDKRSIAEVDEIRNAPAYKKAEEESGLEVTVSVMLPKILWMKKYKPEVFDYTHYFLTPNDFMIYQLCGQACTDELNAIKYQYSINKQAYPSELLNQLGIPQSKLPEVVRTGELAGIMHPEISKQIGCKEGTKVVVTSYDAICSFIGSGVSDEGEASDVSGTVTVFRMLSKKDELIHSGKTYITPFNQGDFNIIGGSNNLGGGLIEWVKQCFYANEANPYELMEKDASESELGARGIIFLPYLLGERFPLWNDSARGVFFGLERMHTRKDTTRAVFEAAAFIDRTMMEAIQETSAEVTTIRLSGGLARVNLISQIKADVTGKEVIVLSEFETTASGAAMMVLNGQEHIPFSELTNFSRKRMTIHPDMENHAKYNQLYKLFKETYKTLEPMFERRLELLKSISNNKEIQIENL